MVKLEFLFGQNILRPLVVRAIRKVIGYSQEKFAQELGVSVSTINRWERRIEYPSRLAIKSIKSYCSKYLTEINEALRRQELIMNADVLEL